MLFWYRTVSVKYRLAQPDVALLANASHLHTIRSPVQRERALTAVRTSIVALLVLALADGLFISAAHADDLKCVSTTFRILGANDKVCISVFDDPKVTGVACHISQARTGGFSGMVGLAEDPSRFSIACRQVGPITADIGKLPDEEQVYSEKTSIFFKRTHVFRVVDKRRNTLVYLAISDKLIEGSPQNSIATVPVMPWGGSATK
jgi:CreA protein